MTGKLWVLMSAEQAEAFARLVEAAERGDGAAACGNAPPPRVQWASQVVRMIFSTDIGGD